MRKKNLFIISLILLVLFLSGCLPRKEQPAGVAPEVEEKVVKDDNISSLLVDLASFTGIDFSGITAAEVRWFMEEKTADGQTEINDRSFTGQGYGALEQPSEKTARIDEFFNNKGFEADLYNISAGTVVGLVGYKKDKLVCTVTRGVTGYKDLGDQLPLEDSLQDVEVNCALLD